MATINVRLAVFFVLAPWILSAQYVGSKACYACHTEIYRSFTQTDMGRSMSLASDWKPGALPAQATLSQPDSTHSFSVLHDDSGWQQSESEPGVFSVQHPLAYSVGSGANGVTFLIRRENYLFQAPLSFYARTQKWDFSPGYERAELGFGRVVPEECINCHAGRSSPVANRPGKYADNPFSELAIGCENCHGPGEAHVKSLGKKSGVIVNPAKLQPRLAENICMNCHQVGDTRVLQPGKNYLDFKPGQWLFNTAVIVKQANRTGEQKEADLLEHYTAMQASRCFRASNGKLGCLTCHDPHVQPGKAEATGYFRAKCLTCHTDQSCKLPIAVRAAQTPANDCVACHMPKRSIEQISHSALTNHRIPARSGEPVLPFPQTELAGLIVVNPVPESPVKLSPLLRLRAYGDLAIKDPTYLGRYSALLDELSKTDSQEPLVQSALGHKALAEDRNDDAVAHLKLALPLDNSTVYFDLGQALAKLGQTDDSIKYLKKGIAADPYNAVIQKTLILQYINLKSYTDATVLIKQYVETFPEDAFMRNILARVSR